MTWDRDNLNAPHTERELGNIVPRAMTYREYLEWREKDRELAQDGEHAPGSTTEPENATCPSAGGFVGLAGAAQTILGAGCSGVPTLTWLIRRDLNGTEPAYAPGDAAFDDAGLYLAVKHALRKMAEVGP